MLLVLLLMVIIPMHRMVRGISEQSASVKTSLSCIMPLLQNASVQMFWQSP